MTSYNIEKLNTKLKKALSEPQMLMTLNEYGKVTYFKHKQITLFEFVEYVSLNYEKYN